MPIDGAYDPERPLARAYDVKLLRRLWRYLRPHGRRLAGAVALVLLITALEVALPYVTKMAIDAYIVPRGGDLPVTERLGGIARLTGLFLLLAAASFGANFLQVQAMEAIGQRVMHRLRIDLFAHVLRLPVGFFDRQPVGRLVTRATNDTQNLHELFTSVVAFVFKDLFLMAGIATILLALDVRLALLSFSILPLVVGAAWRFARRSRIVFRQLTLRLAEINTRLTETIGGLAVIQLMGRETANAQSFKALNDRHYRLGMDQIHVFAVFMPVIEVLSAATLALVIYFGGGAVVAERISLGTLVAYISYMRMFFRPIRDISEKYNIMQNAMASAERIFALMDETAADAPRLATDESPPANVNGAALAFQDVVFGYAPDRPVLDGLSLQLAPGETLAVVGPTGAGKTSMIHLLLRFYEPWRGKIYFGGRDIATRKAAELRREIALVAQEPFLFSDTLGANIFPDGPPAPETAADLLAAAQCTDLVQRLPEGLDTRIGEGGQTLSSGERQLVAIARALARDPALIIFDEATAHIDSATENRIQTALDHLTRQRTAILIAHRLSTARSADRIAVLRHGRIVEEGTHEQLLARRGFYHRLCQQQV
ncbi:MAG: ABC transporter ATP-binding protein [Deltaproteobacteria bacterium]|nr:ABC transporter ATP-binding protein [Deltaproteobacteria bacterium]RLB98888.1 MAG: ABC transporter ATP-binding protein [Deltaproteobacteria bacterium]